MALVTVQRSPSSNNSPTSIDGNTGSQNDMDYTRNSKSLSECYFAGKGTALVLPAAEAQKPNSKRSGNQGSNIQKHLQSMFYLLRPEETLKMAVKLESVHPTRTRYLVVVSCMGTRGEESCLLGIDCNEKTTVGLVLRVMADTTIRLDGDGGFSVSVCGRHHIFKPVSVQAMWSALQTLHKVSSKAREQNYFQGGLTHGWVNYYEERIESDRSCLNEWHAMDNLESKRPPSPDSIRIKPRKREETEQVIKTTLKEIMMSVDLDEVTSKYIRSRLEEDLDMDLDEYKSFIDQEMLTILGQMDSPTEIFEHVYLGSEWNASNYDELQRNGVGHILNVTREIDNFFPGTFDYLNVRVYDDEKTDLLKHWDDTFKYITKAKKSGSKVLVHCKMGISRSASVVIAYAMKAYNWDFKTALGHVKKKRNCIKPNNSFLSQLETYQGILDAMKNKEKLQRSKSETNLKSPINNNNNNKKIEKRKIQPKNEIHITLSGQDLRDMGKRPKSWSPDNLSNNNNNNNQNNKNNNNNEDKSPVFLSLEDLTQQKKDINKTRHVLLPCDNGENYSVSPNQIVHLPGHGQDKDNKERLNELNLIDKKYWDPGDDPMWTSSSKILMTNNSDNVVPESLSKPSDLFSNQVDRVFEREEKKCDDNSSNCSSSNISTSNSSRSSNSSIINNNNNSGNNNNNNNNNISNNRDCPSRQSSWSSYDSAVVLGYNPSDGISRHSSWGSGDNRILPSRNSSWGSYDIKPKLLYDKDDIPWGTVKKTKKKIENNNNNNSAISSSSDIINIPKCDKKLDMSGLSVSAPESSTMELIKSETLLSKSTTNIDDNSTIKPSLCVKQHKTFLENLKKDNNKINNKIEENLLGIGIVKSLKKEFEAKTSSNTIIDDTTSSTTTTTINNTNNKKNNSLPSSPTIHDHNFKTLVHLFENNKKPNVQMRKNNNNNNNNNNNSNSVNKKNRYSCIEVSVDKNHSLRIPQTPVIFKSDDYKRPPISPVVRNSTTPEIVVATVIAKAANKKQQQQFGKSHPLAKLTFKTRHNSPVYNTM